MLAPFQATIIIDDDLKHVLASSPFLKTAGHRVLCFHEIRDALPDLASQVSPIILVADFSRAQTTGWRFVQEAEFDHRLFAVGVIAVTDPTDDSTFMTDMTDMTDVAATLSDPCSQASLMTAIQEASVFATVRHSTRLKALKATATVRDKANAIRVTQGLAPISAAVWDRACNTLCRAEFDYGDDWHTVALAQIIDILSEEI